VLTEALKQQIKGMVIHEWENAWTPQDERRNDLEPFTSTRVNLQGHKAAKAGI